MSDSADDSNWILEEHTERKHRVLTYYLGIWSQILGKPFANLVYWDFFAGRGDYSEGEPGSPLLAMDISKKRFEKGNSQGRPITLTCVFIEKDKKCFYYLRDLLRDLYPDLEGTRWYLFNGDCQEVYNKLQTSEENSIFRKRVPHFFFLDPYGLIIPLDMIKQLMTGTSREVMLTFMAQFVHRFAVDHTQEKNLKDLFGVDDLATLREICRDEDSIPNVTRYYISRLKAYDGARIRHITRPFEMIPDRRQLPLYYLMGCTQSPKGLRIMSASMRAISKNEDFSYRGKFEHQSLLEDFDRDKIGEIAEWIFENYTRNLSVFDLIFTFCCGEQTWSRTEVREAILRLESEGKLVVRPRSGRKRIGDSLSKHFIEFQRE
jgi:three-Cys-motif partner protein